jgi:hypothetical protein
MIEAPAPRQRGKPRHLRTLGTAPSAVCCAQIRPPDERLIAGNEGAFFREPAQQKNFGMFPDVPADVSQGRTIHAHEEIISLTLNGHPLPEIGLAITSGLGAIGNQS